MTSSLIKIFFALALTAGQNIENRAVFLSSVGPQYSPKKLNGVIETAKLAQRPIITKISYSATGGRGGNTENLDITMTTITYVMGQGGKEKTIKEKTPASLWKSLTNSINISDLDKIKTSPGHALYDGIDVTISVTKGKDVHTIVNGNEDSLNYKRIKSFTDILEGQLARLRKKVG